MAVMKLLERSFTDGDEFHYGMCEGWDDAAAEFARDIGYVLVGHPPINTTYLGKVIPDIERPPLGYIERDHRIVDDTERLVAASHTAYEVLRSGTWATVRFAARRDKPGDVVYPDGRVIPLARAVALSATSRAER